MLNRVDIAMSEREREREVETVIFAVQINEHSLATETGCYRCGY